MLEFRYDTQLLIEGEALDEDSISDYITEHFYTCSDEILFSLGQMYAGGGEFMANIDKAGGEGTAAFVAEAIRICCGK